MLSRRRRTSCSTTSIGNPKWAAEATIDKLTHILEDADVLEAVSALGWTPPCDRMKGAAGGFLILQRTRFSAGKYGVSLADKRGAQNAEHSQSHEGNG